VSVVNSLGTRKLRLFGEMGSKLVPVLVLSCLVADCRGQGTLLIGFEGPAYPGAPYPQPPGTGEAIGAYFESGMKFYNPFGPEGVALEGRGHSGYADNGTAFLSTSGGWLRFGFTSSPTTWFNLLSLDLAENWPGSAVVQVVGYKGMGMTVTNTLTTDGIMDGPGGLPDFERFYFDSRFLHVSQVDILSDRWAIDNVMLSGVPEPSAASLLALGILFGLASRWARSRRSSRGAATVAGA
jgi:hypothetical protein